MTSIRPFLLLAFLAPAAEVRAQHYGLELHDDAQRLSYARFYSRLERERISVDYEARPLKEVARDLAERLRVPIIVSSGVIEATRSGEMAPLTLKFPDVAAVAILESIRAQTKAIFVYRGRFLQLLLPEEFRPEVSVRFHYVRDLFYRIPDFRPSVQLGLRAPGTPPEEEEPLEGRTLSGFEPEELEDLLKRVTGGKSWEEDERVSLTMTSSLLVVRQTPRVHEEIQNLLNQLR